MRPDGRDIMDNRISFKETLISKWEEKKGMAYMGEIEIDENKSIKYYDHGFVEDLLNYVEDLFNKLQDTKQKMGELKNLLKGE
jgi:hypothetical protein